MQAPESAPAQKVDAATKVGEKPAGLVVAPTTNNAGPVCPPVTGVALADGGAGGRASILATEGAFVDAPTHWAAARECVSPTPFCACIFHCLW